jgi:hypothetical protein
MFSLLQVRPTMIFHFQISFQEHHESFLAGSSLENTNFIRVLVYLVIFFLFRLCNITRGSLFVPYHHIVRSVNKHVLFQVYSNRACNSLRLRITSVRVNCSFEHCYTFQPRCLQMIK